MPPATKHCPAITLIGQFVCRIVPQFTSKQHIVFPAQCSKCSAIAQDANLLHDSAKDPWMLAGSFTSKSEPISLQGSNIITYEHNSINPPTQCIICIVPQNTLGVKGYE